MSLKPNPSILALLTSLYLSACAVARAGEAPPVTRRAPPAAAIPAASQAAQPSETPVAGEPRQLSYLALGDSYTIGESVAEHERWPVQLVASLAARGLPVAHPTILARTGWTTDELAAALAAERLSGPYDLVSLLIGVNNQYRGRSLEEYRQQFRALLEQASGLAGGDPARVIVVSIPDWGVMPFASGRDRARIAQEIDAFNALNREEALAAGARYVDVTSISRQALADPSLAAADGLHPSASQYAAWVTQILPEALAILAPAQP